MRQVSNILMAMLIVAALFCGNCLSCPQMLMALAVHQPGHSCCHHSTAKIDCHSQELSHFVKAHTGSAVTVLAASIMAPVVAAMAIPTRPPVAPWRAADVAPPDLVSSHSLLRV
jgi:hypothetical protein